MKSIKEAINPAQADTTIKEINRDLQALSVMSP